MVDVKTIKILDEVGGDRFEKAYYDIFLQNEFSNYEKFWQKYVVPLTNRPADLNLLDPVELSKRGNDDRDVCIAQLHYTVLMHLIRVYNIRQIKTLNLDEFTEGIVRLSASTDVADELLGRMTSKEKYDPWNEEHEKDSRRDWRKAGNDQLQWLRDYRNRQLHSMVAPSIIIYGSYERLRVPRFRKEKKYMDWRNVTSVSIGSGGIVRNDYDSPNNLINHAWSEVLKYLNDQWAKVI